MGFRFRRSIKIAPGVKLNIGKRGISSLGMGGLTVGSRGLYGNVGIPGTGISYRSQIAGGAAPAASHSSKPRHKSVEIPFKFALQADGTLLCMDKDGNPLPDAVVQAIRRQKRDLIINWLQKQADQFNAVRGSLLTCHLGTPGPTGSIEVNPEPKPPQFRAHGLVSSLLPSQKQKTDQDNHQLQQDYEARLLHWKQAEQSLRTDTEVMSAVVSRALASIQWPRETSVSFDIVENGTKLLLDVDLPEAEDMPTQQAKVNSRGLQLTLTDITQSQIQLDYLTHIHSIAFRIVGDGFAHLPSVSFVVCAGYSQRVDKKTGQTADEYLYSVRVPRQAWEQINFENLEAIDVVACFESFELKRIITKRGSITPVEPFQS